MKLPQKTNKELRMCKMFIKFSQQSKIWLSVTYSCRQFSLVELVVFPPVRKRGETKCKDGSLQSAVVARAGVLTDYWSDWVIGFRNVFGLWSGCGQDSSWTLDTLTICDDFIGWYLSQLVNIQEVGFWYALCNTRKLIMHCLYC